MSKSDYTAILISDFNVNTFSGYLCNNDEVPIINTIVTPFDQVMPVLMQGDLEYWRNKPDFAVVWTQPENVVKSFNDLLNYKNISLEEIFEEVDVYASLLLKSCDRVKFLLAPIWAFPSYHRGFGMLDMKTGIGISNTLMRMNLRLSDNLDKASNIYLLNTQKWIEKAGKNAFNPKLWYMAKIPFGNQVFTEAVKDIKSVVTAIHGKSKKIIIVDLDDTLWGGIVGDMGWENIALGGHDHIGEAFIDFQRTLESLKSRGILLAIVSKNDEAVALEAINRHPEMVLKLDDFAGWRINWEDKAQNIVDLVEELNLGLQSVVFIDDSPVERARVRETLPEVLVPEWPEDKMLYKSALLDLNCFDTPSISTEDFKRTDMYLSERKRRDLKTKVASFDEWLKSLEVKVIVEQLNRANIQRVTQLLNKTNQMNLTTRRMTESELQDWVNEANNKLWAFRIMDKFGDSGLTGLVSLEANRKEGRIIDFVLSCRVMGRKIEETMLYMVTQYAKSAGLERILAQYVPTAKNKPCLEFWKNSGFAFNEKEGCFAWNTRDVFPLPTHIEISQENYGK